MWLVVNFRVRWHHLARHRRCPLVLDESQFLHLLADHRIVYIFDSLLPGLCLCLQLKETDVSYCVSSRMIVRVYRVICWLRILCHSTHISVSCGSVRDGRMEKGKRTILGHCLINCSALLCIRFWYVEILLRFIHQK